MSAIADRIAAGEISILELVARHPEQEGLRLMTVKAYFDGSGKSHDPNIDCVALAGYVAPEDVWTDFEAAFNAFKKKSLIDYFHACEMEARKGAYLNLGAEETAVLRAGLMDLLRQLRKRDFSAVVYSVPMADYRASTRRLPSPEALCGSGALDAMCATVSEEHELQVFYDRGESFFPRLQHMWQSAKRRKADPRLNRINVFGAVDDWRKYPAIQAADLLAWLFARGPEFKLDLAMLTADLVIYGKDYDALELERIELPLPFYGTVKA